MPPQAFAYAQRQKPKKELLSEIEKLNRRIEKFYNKKGNLPAYIRMTEEDLVLFSKFGLFSKSTIPPRLIEEGNRITLRYYTTQRGKRIYLVPIRIYLNFLEKKGYSRPTLTSIKPQKKEIQAGRMIAESKLEKGRKVKEGPKVFDIGEFKSKREEALFYGILALLSEEETVIKMYEEKEKERGGENKDQTFAQDVITLIDCILNEKWDELKNKYRFNYFQKRFLLSLKIYYGKAALLALRNVLEKNKSAYLPTLAERISYLKKKIKASIDELNGVQSKEEVNETLKKIREKFAEDDHDEVSLAFLSLTGGITIEEWLRGAKGDKIAQEALYELVKAEKNGEVKNEFEKYLKVQEFFLLREDLWAGMKKLRTHYETIYEALLHADAMAKYEFIARMGGPSLEGLENLKGMLVPLTYNEEEYQYEYNPKKVNEAREIGMNYLGMALKDALRELQSPFSASGIIYAFQFLPKFSRDPYFSGDMLRTITSYVILTHEAFPPFSSPLEVEYTLNQLPQKIKKMTLNYLDALLTYVKANRTLSYAGEAPYPDEYIDGLEKLRTLIGSSVYQRVYDPTTILRMSDVGVISSNLIISPKKLERKIYSFPSKAFTEETKSEQEKLIDAAQNFFSPTSTQLIREVYYIKPGRPSYIDVSWLQDLRPNLPLVLMPFAKQIFQVGGNYAEVKEWEDTSQTGYYLYGTIGAQGLSKRLGVDLEAVTGEIIGGKTSFNLNFISRDLGNFSDWAIKKLDFKMARFHLAEGEGIEDDELKAVLENLSNGGNFVVIGRKWDMGRENKGGILYVYTKVNGQWTRLGYFELPFEEYAKIYARWGVLGQGYGARAGITLESPKGKIEAKAVSSFILAGYVQNPSLGIATGVVGGKRPKTLPIDEIISNKREYMRLASFLGLITGGPASSLASITQGRGSGFVSGVYLFWGVPKPFKASEVTKSNLEGGAVVIEGKGDEFLKNFIGVTQDISGILVQGYRLYVSSGDVDGDIQLLMRGLDKWQDWTSADDVAVAGGMRMPIEDWKAMIALSFLQGAYASAYKYATVNGKVWNGAFKFSKENEDYTETSIQMTFAAVKKDEGINYISNLLEELKALSRKAQERYEEIPTDVRERLYNLRKNLFLSLLLYGSDYFSTAKFHSGNKGVELMTGFSKDVLLKRDLSSNIFWLANVYGEFDIAALSATLSAAYGKYTEGRVTEGEVGKGKLVVSLGQLILASELIAHWRRKSLGEIKKRTEYYDAALGLAANLWGDGGFGVIVGKSNILGKKENLDTLLRRTSDALTYIMGLIWWNAINITNPAANVFYIYLGERKYSVLLNESSEDLLIFEMKESPGEVLGGGARVYWLLGNKGLLILDLGGKAEKGESIITGGKNVSKTLGEIYGQNISETLGEIYGRLTWKALSHKIGGEAGGGKYEIKIYKKGSSEKTEKEKTEKKKSIAFASFNIFGELTW